MYRYLLAAAMLVVGAIASPAQAFVVPKPIATSTPKAPPAVPTPLVTIAAEVVDVHDGDTLKCRVDGVVLSVRLVGIDAPELKQPRWGASSRAALAGAVLGRHVQLQVLGVDIYRRTLGIVYVGSSPVQLGLVRSGLALARNFGKRVPGWIDLQAAENAAHQEKAGIWSDATFVEPGAYRKAHGIGRK